jgi:dTDP-4-dehydrorhamnose 3,5-epimerase-like enzyme
MNDQNVGIYVRPVKKVHVDARRSISEATDDASFSVQVFEVFDGTKPLGNHYHPEGKTETFILFKGGGKVFSYAVDTAGQKVGEVVEHSLIAPAVIHIPPWNVHTFYLDPGSTLLCFSSREFRQSDMCPAPVTL